MYARVTITEGSPARIDGAIRFMRETILPQARSMRGFKGDYLLVDRKTGKGMVIALWETEADLSASTEDANRLRAQLAQTIIGQAPKVEVYEVAIQP